MPYHTTNAAPSSLDAAILAACRHAPVEVRSLIDARRVKQGQPPLWARSTSRRSSRARAAVAIRECRRTLEAGWRTVADRELDARLAARRRAS